jgi:hypothetical protein
MIRPAVLGLVGCSNVFSILFKCLHLISSSIQQEEPWLYAVNHDKNDDVVVVSSLCHVASCLLVSLYRTYYLVELHLLASLSKYCWVYSCGCWCCSLAFLHGFEGAPVKDQSNKVLVLTVMRRLLAAVIKKFHCFHRRTGNHKIVGERETTTHSPWCQQNPLVESPGKYTSVGVGNIGICFYSTSLIQILNRVFFTKGSGGTVLVKKLIWFPQEITLWVSIVSKNQSSMYSIFSINNLIPMI